MPNCQKVLDTDATQASGSPCHSEVPHMSPISPADRTDWLTVHDPLTIVVWHDAVVENFGYAPRSPYVETYWLPILGPSATWAMRRLTAWLDATPDGYDLSLSDFGRELGLGSGTGRNAAVVRTLSRLVVFGLATPRGDEFAVRVMLAPLTRRQLLQLPTALAAQHDADMANAVRPLAQRPSTQPASSALCDTTSLVKVAATDNEVRHGEAGIGTADRLGKPTAVPPASASQPAEDGAR